MTAGIKDSGPGSADRPSTSDRTSPFDKNAMGNTTPNPDSKTQFGSSSAGNEASSKTGGQGETWKKSGSPNEASSKTGGQGGTSQKSGSQGESSSKTGSQSDTWPKSGSQSEAFPKTGSQGESSSKTGSQSESWQKSGSQSEASSKTGSQSDTWQKSGSQGEAFPKTGGQGDTWQKSGSQNDASPKAGSQNEPSWKTGGEGGSSGDIAGDSLNTMQGLAQTVRSQASDLVTNIGQELSSTAEANIASGANALRSLAKAMQTAAQEVEPQSASIAQRIRDAAGQVESFTDGISNRNLGELVRAATDLAKRRPAYFVAGAILGGFALARFIKSSNAQSASSGAGRPGYPGYSGRGTAYGGSSGTDNMSSSANRDSSTYGGESGIPPRREDVSYGVSGSGNVNPSSGRNEWAR